MLRLTTLALIAAALAVPAAAPARAQQTVVVGGPPAAGEVTVDMSVLDALGPEPNVPDMMQQGGSRSFVPSTALGRRTLPVAPEAELQPPPGTGAIRLHPPHAAPKRATAARAAPKPKRAASTRAAPKTQQAARAAAPSPVRPPPAAPAPPPAAAPEVSPPALAPAAPPPAATASIEPSPVPASPPPAPAPSRATSEMTSPAGPVPATSASREPPAPAPAPAPAAAPSPPRPQTQTAAIPPASNAAPTSKGGETSLPFPGQEASLSDAARRALDEIASRAVKDESIRLQLMAYASGTGEGANSARRLSLSRALAVRSYLIDKGVRSTRIDVRALGNRVEGGGDPDRVDVIVGAK